MICKTINNIRLNRTKKFVPSCLRAFVLSCLFFSFFISAFAETKEKAEQETKDERKRLSLIAMPLLSFDTDLGIQYGAFGHLFNYGDGSRYPQYDYSMLLEYSRYTKGGQQFRLSFDSDRLIKNIQTNLDVVYLEDLLAFFFGYNGYNAGYSPEMEQMNRAFYRYQNKSFRIKSDFQGYFEKTHFGWIAGVSIMHVNPGSVDFARINRDKTNSLQNLPDDPNMYLFNKYVNWDIISHEETKKKWLNYVKIGFKYDTRDFAPNPFKGMLTEVMLQGAPEFLFNDFPHAKFAVIHRQYVPVVNKRMNFVYRVFYQTTVGNSKVPFYAQPLLMSSFETSTMTQGLGGVRTLRGVLKNRVVGDGFLMVNAEFRLKLFQFNLPNNQHVEFVTNPFIDAGYITKTVDISKQLSQLSEEEKSAFFRDYKQGIHVSAGLGLKMILNYNFVMSLEAGKPFDKRDGEIFRIYLNTSYTF